MEMNAGEEERHRKQKREKGLVKKRVIDGKLNDSITNCNFL